MSKLSPIALMVVTAILAIWLYRTIFPTPDPPPPPIPNIITKYDTVDVLPKWFEDSVEYWKKRKHTTDTVNLTITETIVKTEYVNVTAPPEQRAALWPILSYHGSPKWGDTATVQSFSIQTGNLGISRIFQAGILTSIEVDSGQVTPKFTFAPFPAQRKPSVIYRVKHVLLGVGLCSVVNTVTGGR